MMPKDERSGPQAQPVLQLASSEGVEAIEDLSRAVGTRVSVPFSKRFVRTDGTSRGMPLMTDIYSTAGGRSGVIALKLYVLLVWKAAAPPHTVQEYSSTWARLLDLPNPDGNGSRTVKRATKSLVDRRAITSETQPGHAPLLTLLSDVGDGSAYELPSAAWSKARTEKSKRANLYFKVPEDLWLEGHAQHMSGPAFAMLMILLAEEAFKKPVWITPSEFATRYQLSENTRTRGVAELKDRRLIKVRRESVRDQRGLFTKGSPYLRNTYQLLGPAIPPDEE